MGKIVFVEFLDRRGTMKERVRIDSFPATVGRGYGNAVIVDDRYVGVEHLRLSLDSEGGIWVEALDPVNVTRIEKSRQPLRREQVPPGGEIVLRLGQTVLRMRGDDFAVGPAAPPPALFGSPGRRLASWPTALLVFAVGFGLNVLTHAQAISKQAIFSDLSAMAITLLLFFVLWTGFWSFFNRLVAHSFRFMTHLGIAGIGSVVFLIFFTGNEYFEFLFSAPVAAKAAGFAGFAVIFSLLLYTHLTVMSDSSRRKRLLSCALISAGIAGIALLITITKEREFSHELNFSAVIKPVGRQWVRTVAAEEFFGDLDKVRAKIDAMAKEGRKGKGAKE
jgi:hypothetical protein